MWSAAVCFVTDAYDLFELIGKIGLCVEPSGCINDDMIDSLCFCRSNGIKSHGTWIMSLLGRDDGNLKLFCP